MRASRTWCLGLSKRPRSWNSFVKVGAAYENRVDTSSWCRENCARKHTLTADSGGNDASTRAYPSLELPEKDNPEKKTSATEIKGGAIYQLN